MRFILLIAVLLPLLSAAQINRSAREFAMENIEDYVTKKLLKGKIYKPVSYGELKSCANNKDEINWLVEHRFETEETTTIADRKTIVFRQNRAFFYLDKNMKVLRADSQDIY